MKQEAIQSMSTPSDDSESMTVHDEALRHVEEHRDLFEHYARGTINIEPAPSDLDTFAFNLKTNTIYINSRFYKVLGLSEERTTFATLHEIEHFLEKVRMLQEPTGDRKFAQYVERIEKSKAFGLMDNCVADIRENRAVVSRTHQEFRDIEAGLYKEDLFSDTDFTSEPQHVQFCYTLLREARVPAELCKVSPEVRRVIEELSAITSKDGRLTLLDVMTHPDTPMSTRLALQDKYIWPEVQKLLKDDLEKEKTTKNQNEGDKGESKSQGGGKSDEGDGTEGEPDEALDPNEVFAESYERAEKKVPNAVPIKEAKKAFEEWQETRSEDPLKRADGEYAEKIGVKPEDLKRYRDIVKSLENSINPETGESVIEELRTLIRRIVSNRKKLSLDPQYPVEEGEFIADPAHLVSEVKSGNLTPKAWETTQVVEKPGKKFGEVEITLVCDRSGSMEQNPAKLREQRKAAVLLMEALKELGDLAEEEDNSLIRPLEISSEIYTFQADANDKLPVKKMSKELSEKERIDVSGILSSAPGSSTSDYIPLESIATTISDDTKQKIVEKELKKIIIVFTDGDSYDAGRVKRVIGRMREEGVVVVGVGITEEGKSALLTYAPNAHLAETAEKLPLVLAELLKEHLADV